MVVPRMTQYEHSYRPTSGLDSIKGVNAISDVVPQVMSRSGKPLLLSPREQFLRKSCGGLKRALNLGHINIVVVRERTLQTRKAVKTT